MAAKKKASIRTVCRECGQWTTKEIKETRTAVKSWDELSQLLFSARASKKRFIIGSQRYHHGDDFIQMDSLEIITQRRE